MDLNEMRRVFRERKRQEESTNFDELDSDASLVAKNVEDIHPDLKSVKSGNLSTISLGDVSYSYERRDNRVSFLCSTIDNTSDDSTGLLSLCCWISEKTIENGSWQNEYYELVDSIELGSLKKDYSFSDIEQTFVIPDDLLTIIDSMNEEKDEWHFVFTINELDEDGNNHIIFAVNGPDENEGIKLSIYDESLSIFKDNDDEIRAFVDGEEFSGTLVSSDERFEMEFEESIPVFLRGYHKNGQLGVGGSLEDAESPLVYYDENGNEIEENMFKSRYGSDFEKIMNAGFDEISQIAISENSKPSQAQYVRQGLPW